ncbi:protein FAM117B-like isoform X2 [Contarinia nasturtii]|uniref:protein FAM117B-like isoform X2 n=1 Tax=Contarinia nasturtii TaxID=265458 RepID=UPI0012D413EB|nr:protein FAM117B-like isoform X2 [Contarinia nasturtii]
MKCAMSTTTCNVRGKQSDGLIQKVGPMKATIPMSSLLRPLNSAGLTSTQSNRLFSAMSPPMRLISPDHSSSGHRSPGANNYYKGKTHLLDSATLSSCIRRTVSLDALIPAKSTDVANKTHRTTTYTILQLDKATQTDESCIFGIDSNVDFSIDLSTNKSEKVLRQRLQRIQQRTGEHSVSSQTLSPIQTSPVLIPPRSCATHRPMRSSVEGLNQEIEKLVLVPGQPHSCRPESSHFTRGIPEGHRAPLADILHSDTRSVNTQTPNRDLLSSDESQSTSPDDNVSSEASPRINRFLARLPPDGCEKVCLKSSDTSQDHLSPSSAIFKPPVGFKLRPSLGSAFQPLQPIPISAGAVSSAIDDSSITDASSTTPN